LCILYPAKIHKLIFCILRHYYIHIGLYTKCFYTKTILYLHPSIKLHTAMWKAKKKVRMETKISGNMLNTQSHIYICIADEVIFQSYKESWMCFLWHKLCYSPERTNPRTM
jgi:hypothetical protein